MAFPSPPERKPHGRIVRTPGGYRAFVPEPLPPQLEWDESLIGILSSADRAIGRLAGAGHVLASPLINTLVRKEAVLSSRIEGTQTTLGELLAAQAGAAVERDDADLREVSNYVTALEYGLQRLSTLPMSLRLIREMHERLMRGVRGEMATPGEFRHSQNWIGPPGCTLTDATYIPPPPTELMSCLGAWEKFLHNEALPPLVHAALAHAQFEAIHPFLDGNGRIGRLLITMLLVMRGVIESPMLYLSAHFEATRNEYYARLLGITAHGEWEEWLIYFLKGVAIQSEDVVERSQRIERLLSKWKHALAPIRSVYPARALDLFAENPFWTVGRLAERLRVAFSTAQRTMDWLVAAGVAELMGHAHRHRMYRSAAILDILG